MLRYTSVKDEFLRLAVYFVVFQKDLQIYITISICMNSYVNDESECKNKYISATTNIQPWRFYITCYKWHIVKAVDIPVIRREMY